MRIGTYQGQAVQTAIYPEEFGLFYTVLGLAGEAGEVANKVKKVYRDYGGRVPSALRTALSDELGDVLWYLAAVAEELGLSLETIAVENLYKLRERQREGKIGGEGDDR